MLPKTLKEADGIILATTVEWMGIGGYMQQFLDACWLYADKSKLEKLYMMPVVTATTYGEREAMLVLTQAWEMLGGIPYSGLSAYVENHVDFETNKNYSNLIEKKAEAYYRVINQKRIMLPASNILLKQSILKGNSIVLTPQESEQLSMYVSDDAYVKKQKEDIEELTQLYKEMLSGGDIDNDKEFIRNLKENFHPIEDFSASYAIIFSDIKDLVVDIQENRLKCYYGDKPDADVIAKTTRGDEQASTRSDYISRAFMSGDLTAKGNFKTLYL